MAQRGESDGKCPYCAKEETEKHVFDCASVAARSNRRHELSDLWKRLRKKRILSDLVQRARQVMEDAQGTDATNFPPYTSFYTLTFGFMPRAWAELTEPATGRDRRSGETHLVELIKEIWTYGTRIWTLRNTYHAEKIAPHTEKQKEEDLNDEIRRTFDRGRQGLTAAEKRHFSASPKNILNGTPQHRKAWLRCAKEIFHRAELRTREEFGSERAWLRSWLIPSTTTGR